LNSNTVIEKLRTKDHLNIEKIAKWYFDEWETPLDKTIQRLSNPNNPNVYCQMVARFNNELVSTAGLYQDVNLLKVYPQYQSLGPWIGLLYTLPKYRKQGLGTSVLNALEKEAIKLKLQKIYLYTFTAETLYKKAGWMSIERLRYKGQDTVIMGKALFN